MTRETLQKQPDLYEFTNCIIIGSEFIDHNEHVNNAKYLTIYEKQRDLYMEVFGGQFMPRMFMVDFSGNFKQQLFEGNHVTVFTSAQIEKAHIQFKQRMVRDGVEMADFQCVVCVVDKNGKPTRLPNIIKERISQANLTKQPKQ